MVVFQFYLTFKTATLPYLECCATERSVLYIRC